MMMNNLFKKWQRPDTNAPEEWPAEAMQIEHNVENLKKVLAELIKKIVTCYYSINTPEDKKMKKIPLYSLASMLTEASGKMAEDELLNEVFRNCGELLQRIVDSTLNLENSVENDLICKFRQVMDEDCQNIIKLRKQLTKVCNDLKSAKDRLRNCEQENSNRNNEESQNRLTQAQSQVYEAEREVEQSRDNTLRELYQFESKEGEYAEHFLNYMQLQANYHKECLIALDQEIPQIRRIINEKRKKTVYGKNLEEHLSETNREISYVIETCVTALNKESYLKEQGLFRIAGSKMKIDLLTSSLNVMEASMIQEYEPAVIADALKQYFRSLPEPLLTYDLYNDWVFASKKQEDNPEETIQALKSCCHKLSSGHFNNLRYLIKFLAKVNSFQEHNKMTPQNLGIVFGPNLLKCPPTISQGSVTDMMNNSPGNRVAELLILYADQVFPQEMFATYSDSQKRNSPKLIRTNTVDVTDNHDSIPLQPPPVNPAPPPSSLQRKNTTRSSRKLHAPPPPPPVAATAPSVTPPPKPPLNVIPIHLHNQLGRTPEESLEPEPRHVIAETERVNHIDQPRKSKNSSLPGRPSHIPPSNQKSAVSATASLSRTSTTPSSTDEPPQPLAHTDSSINSPAPLAYPESLSPLQSSTTSATFSVTPPQEKRTPPNRPPTRPPNRGSNSVSSPNETTTGCYPGGSLLSPTGGHAGGSGHVRQFFDEKETTDRNGKKLKDKYASQYV